MMLGKSKKIVLIASISIFAVLGIGVLIYQIVSPRIGWEDQVHFENSLRPDVSYEVHLIENEIYEDPIQKEDLIYIKNILDYILIKFHITYEANQVSSLFLDYDIIATVTGYNKDSNARTDYWSKDFILSENNNLQIDSDYLQKEELVKLDIKEYDDFVVRAKEITGFNVTTELQVRMVGNLKASTIYGNRIIPIDSYVILPLQSNVISIAKSQSQPITDAITEAVEIALPRNSRIIIINTILIVLCIALIPICVIYIKEPSEQYLLRKDMLKLKNKYGSRMIELSCTPFTQPIRFYEVSNIKDLLVVSDDLQRPIYYIRDNKSIVKDFLFYVDNGDDTYVYSHRDYFYRKYHISEIEIGDKKTDDTYSESEAAG